MKKTQLVDHNLSKITIPLEFFAFIYSVFPLLIKLLYPDLWIMTIGEVFIEQSYLFIIPAVLVIFIRIFGFQDSRILMAIHISAVISVSTTSSTINLAFSLTGNDSLLSDIIFGVIPVLFCALSIAYNAWNSATPFQKHLDELINAVKVNNYSLRINDEKILQDGMFGIFFQFIHEMLDALKMNVDQIKNNIDILSSASSNMASTAENVKITTDTTQFISTSISDGANEQTNLLNISLKAMDSMIDDVGDIVNQILNSSNDVSQIALQTNILALNAGIEASRAGDYGRGFAVVAENVRKLSDESKLAAENISEVSTVIISLLQEKLNNFKDRITNIASVAEESSAASEELVASMIEIQANILQLSQNADTLSNQVVETSNLLKK